MNDQGLVKENVSSIMIELSYLQSHAVRRNTRNINRVKKLWWVEGSLAGLAERVDAVHNHWLAMHLKHDFFVDSVNLVVDCGQDASLPKVLNEALAVTSSCNEQLMIQVAKHMFQKVIFRLDAHAVWQLDGVCVSSFWLMMQTTFPQLEQPICMVLQPLLGAFIGFMNLERRRTLLLSISICNMNFN